MTPDGGEVAQNGGSSEIKKTLSRVCDENIYLRIRAGSILSEIKKTLSRVCDKAVCPGPTDATRVRDQKNPVKGL